MSAVFPPRALNFISTVLPCYAEVGHNAMGAGQIIDQGAKLVDKAVASGSVFDGEGWQYLQPALDNGNSLHFIGLLSDGGVHSRYDQLHACLKGACKYVMLPNYS